MQIIGKKVIVPFHPIPRPFPDFDRKMVIVSFRIPSWILTDCPGRPVPWQDFDLLPVSLCPRTMKELLSLYPKKLHCSVLLETQV